MDLKEKLDLWVKITGVNPEDENRQYSIYLDGRLSDYDVKKWNDRIKESLNYDETGAFADAYLALYFEEFIKGKSFSLKELAENDDCIHYMEDIQKLYSGLKESDSGSIIMSQMKKAMDFYGLEHDKLNVLAVMELITSAKKCIKNRLRLEQVLKGNVSKDSFHASREIYMYENISDVIKYVAKGLVSGVSMCYIHDKQMLEDSYFAFVIKNGENLYILSDKPVYVSPTQKQNRRCPGRYMSDRIESNRFPYETLSNIDISDMWDSGRYGLSEKEGSISNILNEEMRRIKIGTLASMNQDEAFWAIYMFDLIRERFYMGRVELEELSYSGCQLRHPLIEVNEKDEVALLENLPQHTLELVDSPEKIKLEYGREPVREFEYLVERYKDSIDPAVFNLVEGMPLLGDEGEKDDYLRLDLHTLNTHDGMVYNQKWIARYNMAVAVQKVDEDYKKNWANVMGQIKMRVASRFAEIVKMHLRGELNQKKYSWENFGWDEKDDVCSFSKHISFERYYNDMHSRYNAHLTFAGGYNKVSFKCAITGSKPGVVVYITPQNAMDIALVLNCKIDELPIELQHYNIRYQYTGNPILENIDPFDQILNDPYNKLNFNIAICLSFKEFTRLQKEAGVPIDEFWKKEKPTCFDKNQMRGASSDFCRGVKRYSYEDYAFHLTQKCEKCKYLFKK